MPGGDRTGPAGMGPMTGRVAGFCAGYDVPGYMNPIGRIGYRGWGPRQGFGRGFGRARGAYRWPNWYGPGINNRLSAAYNTTNLTAEQEFESLKEQAEYFKNALEEINKRMEQLEKTKK